MSEISYKEDISKLKEELENRFEKRTIQNTNQLNKLEQNFESQIKHILSILNENSIRLKSFHDNNLTINLVDDKLNELFKFKQSTDDKLFTNDINVSNITSNIKTSFEKYDNYILENHEVPGIVENIAN